MKNILLVILLLAYCSIQVNASVWLDEVKAKSCCTTATKKSNIKEFSIKKGDLQNDDSVDDLSNVTLYIRDMNNQITEQNLTSGKISFTPQYKGSYYLFFEKKSIKDGVLYIETSSLRSYNKEGNISKSISKEVRGKTIDSKQIKEPFPQLPFEIIMDRPIRKHHINCCLYSGDIAPFRVYYKGKLQKNIPLKVTTQTGWSNIIKPSNDGVASFEIPKTTYEDGKKDKRSSEKMIMEATYQVDESGQFGEQHYNKIIYSSSMVLTFGNSPLEYESKVLGFATTLGVALIISLGLYYNRRRKQKTTKEIWFDEK
jgi:hypothetical protein